MPVYRIGAPDGRTIRIEAADEQTAMSGAQEWATSNPIAQQTPPQPAAPAQAPSTTGDVLKSAGIGVAQSAIGIPGLPGDIGGLMSKGSNWLLQKAGLISPEAAAQNEALAGKFTAPSSQDIQKTVESATGKFYEPQTTAGEYARTGGNFAIAGLTPGSAARKIAQVAVPALATETAGQAARAVVPGAEPAARLGAALASGRAVSGRPSPVPSKEQLFAKSGELYDQARSLGVEYHPSAVAELASSIKADLRKRGFTERTAPGTYGALDDMKKPPQGGPSYLFSDLETDRRVLNETAQTVNSTERAAANISKKAIDSWVENPTRQDVLFGPADVAAALNKEARATNAAAQSAKKLDIKENVAEIKAGGEHSGLNIGNKLRQQVGQMLIENAKIPGGYAPEAIAQMNKINQGTLPINAVRFVDRLLGGGGGLGALATGAGFGAVFGPAGMVAAPVAGRSIRGLSNYLTKRDVKKLNEMLRARAPMSQEAIASAPRYVDPRTMAAFSGILGSMGPR